MKCGRVLIVFFIAALVVTGRFPMGERLLRCNRQFFVRNLRCRGLGASVKMTFVGAWSPFQKLEAGDVVTTATPPAGLILPGDIIETEIEGMWVQVSSQR